MLALEEAGERVHGASPCIFFCKLLWVYNYFQIKLDILKYKIYFIQNKSIYMYIQRYIVTESMRERDVSECYLHFYNNLLHAFYGQGSG